MSDDAAAPFPRNEYDLTPPLGWFPLSHAGRSNAVLGLRSGGDTFVARRYTSRNYRDRDALAHEEHMLAWLAARPLSFAVPVPLPSVGGARHCRIGAGIGALLPFLPGEPLALQDDDGSLLGAATGELQAALAAHYPTPRPGRALFAELFDAPLPHRDPLALTPAELDLAANAEHDALLGWWRAEAARLRAFADGPYRALPAQLCHNDVTPNNVLAADGRVTAVLDFEFATVAARALDFATGLRQSIRHWLPGGDWPAVRPYCRGFARFARLSPAEIAALPDLLLLRGATTALWWLGDDGAGEDNARVLDAIGNLRRLAHWLEGNAARLIETAGEELTR